MPAQLADETPPADLPDDVPGPFDLAHLTESVKRWQAFGDAQTGQLDKANLTKAAGLDIIRKCEARDAELDAALTKRRKILGIF